MTRQKSTFVRRAAPLVVVALVLPLVLHAQITSEQILNAAKEPQNWLTYSGTYMSQRFSTLNQITRVNVRNLEQKWVFQPESLQVFEATPLVVDGIMYFTQSTNDVVALDAKTGRVFWIYEYRIAPEARPCCGAVNRGLAMLGDTLFMGTIDAHLVAIDAKTGRPIWNVKVAEPSAGYALTLAPLVVKDKIVIGIGGGEYGIRGFIAAFDRTGKEVWRFNTIPSPGEPGHETWKNDAWEHGGGPAWLTGSYDPALNLLYWGIGNPSPDWNPAQRPGDNLYTDSVVALDADTGKLKSYYQFTPNDGYDYDSVQIPVLIDATWQGNPRKLLVWGNRNGYFYVLDRTNLKFLAGHPFVNVNWAKGFDENGRPIQTPQGPGQPTYPGNQGGTNWYSPSYSPRTRLFYLSTWTDYGSVYVRQNQDYEEGKVFAGGRPGPVIPNAATVPPLKRGPINQWTEQAGRGETIAIDPQTGQTKWRFGMADVTDSGILTTATDLLFTGGREGHFYALDAETGQMLWKASLGGQITSGPITFAVDGKQYVTVNAGHNLFTFALRDEPAAR